MESANYVAVIAILAEMARCLNKNITKVRLKPINYSVIGDGAINLAKVTDCVAKA